MSEQDYIPGTSVIKNLVERNDLQPYGTTSAMRLAEYETAQSSFRMAELRANPIKHEKPFSFGHMRAIHKHLFQDVYAWAGEPRRVPMNKLGTDYAHPTEMNALLRKQYSSLAKDNFLRGIQDKQRFVEKLSLYWNEIRWRPVVWWKFGI